MKYKAENGNQDYDRIAINMWITDKKNISEYVCYTTD